MAENKYKFLKDGLTDTENRVVEIYPKFLSAPLSSDDRFLFIYAFQLNEGETTHEVPYDLMTAIIFQEDFEYEDSLINDNISMLDLDDRVDSEIALHTLRKIHNHTALAFTQKREFSGVLQQAEADREQLAQAIQEQKREVKVLTEKTKRVSIEFTTVLGIFTSIVFALFGGVQVVSTLLSNTHSLTAKDMGDTILLASVATTLVYLLLIALLSGISKLTDNQYNVSGKVTAVVLLTLVFMALLGVLYGYDTASGQLLYFLQSYTLLVPATIIVAIILIVILVACTLMRQDKSKSA